MAHTKVAISATPPKVVQRGASVHVSDQTRRSVGWDETIDRIKLAGSIPESCGMSRTYNSTTNVWEVEFTWYSIESSTPIQLSSNEMLSRWLSSVASTTPSL